MLFITNNQNSSPRFVQSETLVQATLKPIRYLQFKFYFFYYQKLIYI